MNTRVAWLAMAAAAVALVVGFHVGQAAAAANRASDRQRWIADRPLRGRLLDPLHRVGPRRRSVDRGDATDERGLARLRRRPGERLHLRVLVEPVRRSCAAADRFVPANRVVQRHRWHVDDNGRLDGDGAPAADHAHHRQTDRERRWRGGVAVAAVVEPILASCRSLPTPTCRAERVKERYLPTR